MITLAEQQVALLDALFTLPDAGDVAPAASKTPPLFCGVRGLQAYRANGHAQAERSLLATYPVLAQLLGLESFSMLSRDFWHHHPPVLGDLAQWGGELSAFVRENPLLHSEPYLSDVARVEWALHCAALATDATVAPASLALLADAPPERLRLLLTSGITVIASPYPVASIVCAHISAEPSLEEAGRLLQAGVAETAKVWRQGLRPRIAPCASDEAAFLEALLEGSTLAYALDQVAAFAFDQWLPRAVGEGLVLGAALTRA